MAIGNRVCSLPACLTPITRIQSNVNANPAAPQEFGPVINFGPARYTETAALSGDALAIFQRP